MLYDTLSMSAAVMEERISIYERQIAQPIISGYEELVKVLKMCKLGLML